MATKAKAPLPLTGKQERFCQEWAIDHNSKQAALRAGYSAATAHKAATEILPLDAVQARIHELMSGAAKRAEISLDRVVAEFAKVAFANMGEYIRIGEDGDPFVDLTQVKGNPEALAAISETTVEDFYEGRGEDARQVRKVKIKLHGKLDALNALGRHLGMFEKEEKNDGPVTIILGFDPQIVGADAPVELRPSGGADQGAKV